MTARLSLLLPLVFVIGALPSAPIDGTNLIELLPKWKKGDTLRYELTRNEMRETDGKVVHKTSCRTLIEVEVVSADDDGSVVRWTQGSAQFDDPKFDDDPFVKAMNTILKGIDIELEIDSDGELVGVRNWREVRGTGLKIQAAVLMQFAKNRVPKDTIEYIRKETERMFETKESIEAAFTRQPALLLLPLGKTYEAGKPTAYEDELPNPFGGDPFPSKGEYSLKSVDKDAGLARVIFRQTPDPKELNTILRKVLEDHAKKAGKPAPDKLPNFAMEDTVEYEVYLGSGWVKSATHTRLTKSDTTTQLDVVKITQRAK